MKNTELVKFVISKIGNPCWYRTSGERTTQELWNVGEKRYPVFYTALYKYKSLNKAKLGKESFQGVGLLAGALIDDECYSDIKNLRAKELYALTSNNGLIADNFPSLAGIAVWSDDFKDFGIYTGESEDEAVVTAPIFGKVEYKPLSDFKYWATLPFIDYSIEEEE